jgi:hypothetical protein
VNWSCAGAIGFVRHAAPERPSSHTIRPMLSADALKLSGSRAPPAGYEIVPTEEGKALVAYLISLKRNYALPEAPEPAE